MFMAVVGLGVLALHLYLWKRLVRDTTRSPRVRRVGTVVLAVLAVLAVAALVLPRFVGVRIAEWFAWPGYLWLAVFFYLLLTLAVLELPRMALRYWTRPSGETDESRRLFLARAAGVVAGATAASVVGAGAVSALGPPAVKRVAVPIGGLPSGLRGLRIAVVSDIHLGPLLGRAHTERIVRMLNETQPDLVAMVGDLADGTVAELGHAAAPLGDLVAPTYFVTTNLQMSIPSHNRLDLRILNGSGHIRPPARSRQVHVHTHGIAVATRRYPGGGTSTSKVVQRHDDRPHHAHRCPDQVLPRTRRHEPRGSRGPGRQIGRVGQGRGDRTSTHAQSLTAL
ncbi:hypothetical protein JOD54_000802 [Actinokineospora baliensis]|uniref:metallophosphoesterase n=1 Tax=Actinokineospora baliensis TaxID=547056 RepID=UPI001EF7D2DD|nr:metallophosphoesterase [Actinokineospora baliensis]MBM7770598.1 hypothetical protein [Actinokineospora baliensis]